MEKKMDNYYYTTIFGILHFPLTTSSLDGDIGLKNL